MPQGAGAARTGLKRGNADGRDAATPEAIRKVAERNGLPVGRITQVNVLDPCFYVP